MGWELAARKLPEVDALIARAERMKRLLEAGLRCECLTLEDCARAPASEPGDREEGRGWTD